MINNVEILEIYVRNRLGKCLWLKNEIPYAPEHTIPHYQLHISRVIYLNLAFGSDRALKEILFKNVGEKLIGYVKRQSAELLNQYHSYTSLRKLN